MDPARTDEERGREGRGGKRRRERREEEKREEGGLLITVNTANLQAQNVTKTINKTAGKSNTDLVATNYCTNQKHGGYFTVGRGIRKFMMP